MITSYFWQGLFEAVPSGGAVVLMCVFIAGTSLQHLYVIDVVFQMPYHGYQCMAILFVWFLGLVVAMSSRTATGCASRGG